MKLRTWQPKLEMFQHDHKLLWLPWRCLWTTTKERTEVPRELESHVLLFPLYWPTTNQFIPWLMCPGKLRFLRSCMKNSCFCFWGNQNEHDWLIQKTFTYSWTFLNYPGLHHWVAFECWDAVDGGRMLFWFWFHNEYYHVPVFESIRVNSRLEDKMSCVDVCLLASVAFTKMENLLKLDLGYSSLYKFPFKTIKNTFLSSGPESPARTHQTGRGGTTGPQRRYSWTLTLIN